MKFCLSHTLRLFNIFRAFDGKENCAQVLEEECIKMLDTKSLNEEHDWNVVSINSLNIHTINDDCSSHDENGLPQTTLQPNNKESLVSPTHPIQ